MIIPRLTGTVACKLSLKKCYPPFPLSPAVALLLLITSVVIVIAWLGSTSKSEQTQSILIKLKVNDNLVISAAAKLCPTNSWQPVFQHARSGELKSWYQCRVFESKVEHVKTQFNAYPFVAHVELDQNLSTASLPNDPLFAKQWPLVSLADPGNPAVYNQFNDNADTISKIWALAKPKREVIVAVLDTGVDYLHEDLKDRMWINTAEQQGVDGFDDDNNGCVDDIYGCDFRSNVIEKIGYIPGLGGRFYQTEPYIYPDGMGHGTLIAGIIAAQTNNHIGIAGISHHAKIMSVKFINQNNVASMKDAALAIQYAVDNGANIINNSYGKNKLDARDFQILHDAINYASQHNVLFIAASGNFGVNIDSGEYAKNFYPANFELDNIISVAALDSSDNLWGYSNYGATSVDLAAPGVSIWSTAPKGPTSLFRKLYDPTGYLAIDGTSIATPFVSGTAALIFAMNPQFNHHDVKRLLLSSTKELNSLQNKLVTRGKLDIYQAVLNASKEIQ